MVGGELKYGSYRGVVGVDKRGKCGSSSRWRRGSPSVWPSFEKIRVGVKLSTLVVKGKSKEKRCLWMSAYHAIWHFAADEKVKCGGCSGDKERVC